MGDVQWPPGLSAAVAGPLWLPDPVAQSSRAQETHACPQGPRWQTPVPAPRSWGCPRTGCPVDHCAAVSPSPQPACRWAGSIPSTPFEQLLPALASVCQCGPAGWPFKAKASRPEVVTWGREPGPHGGRWSGSEPGQRGQLGRGSGLTCVLPTPHAFAPRPFPTRTETSLAPRHLPWGLC